MATRSSAGAQNRTSRSTAARASCCSKAPDLSYRTALEQWVGLPLTPPVGAARRAGTGTTVYASWNGATRLASWRVLAGSGTGHLAAIVTHAKSGFETAIPVPGSYANFEVQALDANGRVIGTSRPFAA